MSPSQRDAVTYAVGEETGPLFERIAELELSLAYAQDQIAELEPMRPVQEALHNLILRSDCVQYDPATNTLHLGRATFAALGDETVLRAIYAAAQYFTEDE